MSTWKMSPIRFWPGAGNEPTREQMIDEAVRLARKIWGGSIIRSLAMRYDRVTITLRPGALEMIRAEFRRLAA